MSETLIVERLDEPIVELKSVRAQMLKATKSDKNLTAP